MSGGISDPHSKIRITVLTPTYNRAYILGNLYNSLLRQTYKNFEWLVIDDGSADETATIIHNWITQGCPFLIRYYRQENGGKHRAINRGLQLAEGELFFVVDSDDYLTDDALEKINRWFKDAEADPAIVSVAANKGFTDAETHNNLFEEDYLDMSFLDMNTYREHGKLVLSGERAIAFYTDLHRKYLYPEYENERFLTEAIVYNRIAADGYKTRFFNDIIWIFEYQKDGLSFSGTDIYLKNPHGYGLWFREKALFYKYSLFETMKMRYSFYCDLKDLYSRKTIAECIGAPVWEMYVISALHYLKGVISRSSYNGHN